MAAWFPYGSLSLTFIMFLIPTCVFLSSGANTVLAMACGVVAQDCSGVVEDVVFRDHFSKSLFFNLIAFL